MHKRKEKLPRVLGQRACMIFINVLKKVAQFSCPNPSRPAKNRCPPADNPFLLSKTQASIFGLCVSAAMLIQVRENQENPSFRLFHALRWTIQLPDHCTQCDTAVVTFSRRSLSNSPDYFLSGKTFISTWISYVG